METRNQTSLLDVIDKCPPCICRLHARKENGRHGMSHRDIAKISGLGKTTVAELSVKTSWKGVKIEVAEAFARACGVNLLRPCDVRQYFTSTKRYHLVHPHKNRIGMLARIFGVTANQYSDRLRVGQASR